MNLQVVQLKLIFLKVYWKVILTLLVLRYAWYTVQKKTRRWSNRCPINDTNIFHDFQQNQVNQITELNDSIKSVSTFGKKLGSSILFIRKDRNVTVVLKTMTFPQLTFHESIRSFPWTNVKTGEKSTSNDKDNRVKLKYTRTFLWCNLRSPGGIRTCCEQPEPRLPFPSGHSFYGSVPKG